MATANGVNCKVRAVEAFQPVSEMLDVGHCEPLKAVVHGIVLATVAVCAAYNTAAWLKRRQRHLGINAVVYSAAVWWEYSHVMHHLAECEPVTQRLAAVSEAEPESIARARDQNAA